MKWKIKAMFETTKQIILMMMGVVTTALDVFGLIRIFTKLRESPTAPMKSGGWIQLLCPLKIVDVGHDRLR